ncbi:MAG: hypothetical protein ACO1RT_06395 [Planctomycetaceae bacterium]
MSLFCIARWLRCAISRRIRADLAEIGGAAGFFGAALVAGLLVARAGAAVLAVPAELLPAGAALRSTLLAAGLVPDGVLTACSALTDRLDVIAADAGDLAACDFAGADVLAAAGVREGFTALVAAIPLSCLAAGDGLPLGDLVAAAAGREADFPLEVVLAAALALPAFEGCGLAVAATGFAALEADLAAVLVLLDVAAAEATVFLADVEAGFASAAARLADEVVAAFAVTDALDAVAADFLSAVCLEPDASGLAFADDFGF